MKDKVKFKIGEEVIAKKSYELKGFLDEEKTIQVHEGDKAFITGSNCIRHTTGEARGKIQQLSKEVFEVSGYDHENIATMILNRLMLSTPMKDLIEDYGIEEKEILNEIEDILFEIL